MTTQADSNEQAQTDASENDDTAISAALSVHYIVLALYALPAIASIGLLIMVGISNPAGNTAGWIVLSIITLTLFFSHFLAIKGLRNRKKWGRNTSIALALVLLLLFPFGTVLGAILLSQLIKFKF